MFHNLTDENIKLYAIKCYSKPNNMIMSEFDNDFQHIKYIKKLFKTYKTNKGLKERLILNHIICLGNVFGVEATNRMLFFYMDLQEYSVLKTFLLFLQYLPDIIVGIKGYNINTNVIKVDNDIMKKLERI